MFKILKTWSLKKRLLLTGSAVLVLLVGLGVYWFFEGRSVPMATILPEDTAALVEVTTNIRDRAVRQFLEQGSIDAGQVNQATTDVGQQFFDNRLLDPEEIKKLLGGNIGVALVPIDDANVVPLLVIQSKKPSDALQVIDRLVKSSQRSEEDYRGQKVVRYVRDGGAPDLYATTLKHFVVVTKNHPLVFSLIDRESTGDTSLAKSASYRLGQQKTVNSTPVHLYFNSDSGFAWLTKELHLPIPEQWANPLGGDVFVGGLYIEQGAIAVNGFWHHALKNKSTVATALLSHVPTTTQWVLAGHDLQQQITAAQNYWSSSDPLFSYYFRNVQKYLQDNFSFSLQKDFLDLLTGDYQILRDERTSYVKSTGQRSAAVTFVVQVKDPSVFKLSQSLLETAVAGALKSQYDIDHALNFTIVRDDATVHWTVLDDPRLPVAIHFALVDNRFIVSTNEAVLRDLIEVLQGDQSQSAKAVPADSFVAMATGSTAQLARGMVNQVQFASLSELYSHVTVVMSRPEGEWLPISVRLEK